MWTKIYLALLAMGVLVAAFFAYYAWSWLQSIGDPRVAWEAFNYNKRGGAYFLLCWTIVLVVVANVVLWNDRKAWALGITQVYFVVFCLILLVWLHISGVTYCLDNNVCREPSRFVGPLLTVAGSVGLSVALIIDDLIVGRLRKRMHGEAETEKAEKESSRPEAES